jgi:hypothetical protein
MTIETEFYQMCIPYAIMGYLFYLKNEKKNNKQIKKVELKKHTIDENENDCCYSKYHYYIEIHMIYEFDESNTYKYIIDNEFAMSVNEYKKHFAPENIVIFSEKEIIREYNELIESSYDLNSFLELVKKDIEAWLLFLSIKTKMDLKIIKNLQLTEKERNFKESKDYFKRRLRLAFL